VRTGKRKKNGYLLPVVSVCTGRQVRPAPPSCCHCSNIIHMYLHFRQTIWLSSHRFVVSTRISMITFVLRSPFGDEFNTAYACNTRSSTIRRSSKKDIQTDRALSYSRKFMEERAYSFAIYQHAFFSAVIAPH